MAAQVLDLGVGDVHVPGAARAETKHTMAEISADARKKLPASKFADPAARAYPIHDKAHADDAASRLEQQKASMSPGKFARVKSRIKAAQKRFGEGGDKPKTAATRSSFRGNARGLRMSISHSDGTRTEIRHLAAYSDADDRLILSIPLNKAEALADGDADKRVWVQVGKSGRWLGHRQGPFELNSQVFDSLVSNFKSQNVGRLQYDFEHSSEMKPTDGMIPMIGSPAQGWIYDLKHDGRNLYALTEWKDLARQYIENDQYGGVSPAISWKNNDRVSGQPIGPMLTSVALTNKPFLTGMRPPQAASAEGVTWLTAEGGDETEETTETLAGAYCYSTDEYMPRIKSALGLHELSTPQQCSEQLSNLRGHFDAAGGDAGATPQGVSLSKYLLPMRDLTSAPMGSTWDDVFDAVDDLIDAAIEEHEAEFHPDGPPDADASAASNTTASAAAPAAPQEPIQMAMTEDELKILNDAKSQLATVQSQLSAKDAQIATLTTELSTARGEHTTLSTQLQTATTQLSLKVTEVDTLKTENTTLATAQAATKAKEVEARVTEVIKTYGTKKGLTEDSRKMLTHLCSSVPDVFDAEYPPLPADQQHLLTNHTERGSKDPKAGALAAGDLPEMSLMSIATQIAETEKLPYDQALAKAEKILNQAKKKKS